MTKYIITLLTLSCYASQPPVAPALSLWIHKKKQLKKYKPITKDKPDHQKSLLPFPEIKIEFIKEK